MSDLNSILAGRSGTPLLRMDLNRLFELGPKQRWKELARRSLASGKNGRGAPSICGADYALKKCHLLGRCSIFEAQPKPEPGCKQLPVGCQ